MLRLRTSPGTFWLILLLGSIALAGVHTATAMAAPAEQDEASALVDLLRPSTTFASAQTEAADIANAWLPEPDVSFLGRLPWVSAADRQNRTDASWYWNTHYRGGRGQAGLTGFHYYNFTAGGFENPPLVTGTGADVNGADFEEMFFGAYLQGVIYPMIQLNAEGGTMLTNVKFPNLPDSVQYGFGFYYGAGVSFSYPIHQLITPVVDFNFRGWLAQGGDGTELTGYDLRGSGKIYFEIIQDPENVSWDFYVGAGAHIHRGSIESSNWTVPGRDFQDFDLCVGTVIMLEESGAIRIDVRLPNIQGLIRIEITG